jgi:predicted RNase H-like HicB family nuclease
MEWLEYRLEKKEGQNNTRYFMHKHYPIVIHKDADSDYCVTVPDLPGCITAGDTLEDAQNQAVEAIQCHIEGMLLDGEPIPEVKEIAFHQDNPDYTDGVWKSITIVLPDISEIRVSRPGRIQKFFQWFSQTTQTLRKN